MLRELTKNFPRISTRSHISFEVDMAIFIWLGLTLDRSGIDRPLCSVAVGLSSSNARPGKISIIGTTFFY